MRSKDKKRKRRKDTWKEEEIRRERKETRKGKRG